MFTLNILCDSIHDAIDKHVYVFITRAVGQFQKRLASVTEAKRRQT